MQDPMSSMSFPITLSDVHAARDRIAPYLDRTPLRSYPELDAAVGAGIRLLVKHENHQPTNSFKVRNGLAALTALGLDDRRRGVVCASRGNHGQGVAYAGSLLGIPVTVVVPHGNNEDKNSAMRSFGARVLEKGANYDEAVTEADRLAHADGLAIVHSTNNPDSIAGAGTLALEVLEQEQSLDAMVIAVGGGSQAVGAMTVLRAQRPEVGVYAVQATGAPAVYKSWKSGRPVKPINPVTIADGVATATSYAMTLPALCAGLRDFATVDDDAIIAAARLLIRTTHNLVEPAGAVGLAGLKFFRERFVGKTVCIILSGSNVDADSLRRIVAWPGSLTVATVSEP